MQPPSPLRLCLLAALTLAGGCTAPTGPSPAEVAGVYRLELMDGRTVPDTAATAAGYLPYAGAIILYANGDAARSVTFRDGTGRLLPIASAGSFEVRGAAVELRLKESSDYTWRVRGDLVGAVLTLRYPGAADADVTERYRRE